MKSAWLKITENLKKTLDSGVFRLWIAPLSADIRGHDVHLVAPNDFMSRWIQNHVADKIRQAAAAALNIPADEINLIVKCREGAASETARPETPAEILGRCMPSDTARDQAYLALSANFSLLSRQESGLFKYSFDNFVVGRSNQLAVAAARDLCSPRQDIRTLFVNANSGLGKTHLAQAVCRDFNHNYGTLKVCYLTSEKFASLFVAALKNKAVEDFKNQLVNLDVLLLEDVHFFQGKEKMQDMLLSMIKNLQSHGGKVILTSSFSPCELRKIDGQLVSYFCSGIIAGMQAPDHDMRCEILQRKARSHQVLLPDELCTYLASRLKDDVRQLESCLNNMIFKAKLLNRSLDMDLAIDILSQYESSRTEITIDRIISLVCECYGLGLPQLCSRSRKNECVLGRNTAFYLARKYTDLSLQQIGDRFNRRHSTVLKGITSLEREMVRESHIGHQAKKVLNLIERNAGIY